MKKTPFFSWDPETGSALCVLFDRDKTYYGTATCAAADKDMMSEEAKMELGFL